MNAIMNVQTTDKKATIHQINPDTVYTDIMEFLNEYPSKSTRENYQRDIRDYFYFMCKNKEISMLTREDVEKNNGGEKLLNKHANRYKTYLQQKHPDSNNSVIRKMNTIRALYKYLQINGYDVDHMIFTTKGIKADTESYDHVPSYLVYDFSEKAKENPHHGFELSVFILVSAQTSIRVNALLSLTKRNIKYDKDSNKYTVTVVDKGQNTRTCPINQDIYNRVVELIEMGDSKNPKVFQHIQKDWIRKAIQKIAKDFPELDGKKIVTHSLRSTGAVYEMKTTGNVQAAMSQTGHKSVQVFMDAYTDKSATYDSLAGIKMFQKANEEVLELVTKEEILDLLKKMNPMAHHQLVLEIEKIVGL